MQNRSYDRVQFESQAVIMFDGQHFEALTDNLSLGGLFVRTERDIPVGKKAEILLTVPSASRSSTVNLEGVVVRHDAHGLAFQFKSLDYESFAYLKAVLGNKPRYGVRHYHA